MRHLTMRVDDELMEKLEELAEHEARRFAEVHRVPRVGNRSATARWVLEIGLRAIEEMTDGKP